MQRTRFDFDVITDTAPPRPVTKPADRPGASPAGPRSVGPRSGSDARPPAVAISDISLHKAA